MVGPPLDETGAAGAVPRAGPPSDVSVIVPCRNAARYLVDALASILEQSLPPAEVIVVDDGSTDDSAHVASRFAPRVTLVRQPQQGIAGARNRGLSAAHGALIAFLDADDVWPRDSLLHRWRRLAGEHELDGVYGHVTTYVNAEDASAGPTPRVPPAQAGRLAGALLLRREAFTRVGPFDTRLRVGETLDWIARATERGVRLAAVDAPVLARRVHGGNSVRDAASTHADYLRVLRASLARRRGTADANAGADPHPARETPQ